MFFGLYSIMLLYYIPYFPCLWVYFCFVYRFICVLFYIPHICDIMIVVLWLISLSIVFSKSTHVAVNSIFHSFLCVIFHCVCIAHSFLSQFPVDGPLCCLHVLAVVHSAAMNTGVHIAFWMKIFVFFLDIYARLGLLDHTVVLFLVV